MGCASLVHAAEITEISGTARGDRGAGFELAAVGEQLLPNDRVLVSKGYATIVFSYRCQMTVHEGESYLIPEDPQCGPAAAETALTQPEEARVDTILLWGAGIGVVGGLVAIGIASDKSETNNDGARPASP